MIHNYVAAIGLLADLVAAAVWRPNADDEEYKTFAVRDK